MSERFGLVIVGGGIGGGALATVMARAGHSVLVLEKSTVYPDKVRGEWLAPWGVLEAKRIGIYDDLLKAGGHHLVRHVDFGDHVDSPAEALANPLDMTVFFPDAPGPLTLRHPIACQALADAATAAGARVLRGADVIAVEADVNTAITYRWQGETHKAIAPLVVGADGRAGATRARLGLPELRDPTHHLFTGMLVSELNDWPADLQTKGTEGDVNFLVFPQGHGYARLYLGYGYDQKKRFAGRDAQRRFLDAFRLESVPGSDELAAAKPESDVHSYPNEDRWVEQPYVDGAVMIGDAAGHNDPIIGQGLSITLRDVRLVSEALRDAPDWSRADFRSYAEERLERMRRLRFAAALTSTLDSEFGAEPEARRRRVYKRWSADPETVPSLVAALIGPELLPAEAFTAEAREQALSLA